MTTYTYAQIGQRAMERNPEAFKGLSVTPDQVGQRIVARNPQLKSLLNDTTTKTQKPATPALTPDQASGQQTGAFLPANTSNPGIAEPLKVLPNMIPSAFNFAKGAVDLVNPISTAKKVGQVITGFGGLKGDLTAQKQSEQNATDSTNKLIQLYQQKKAAGQDTSHLETFFKNSGIDYSQFQVAPKTTGLNDTFGSFAKELPGAAVTSLVPDAGRAVGRVIQGAFTGNGNMIDENLQRAQRDVINDPVGSILPFILAAEGGAKVLDKAGITTDAAGALDRGISKTGQAGIAVADTITKPVQYAFGKVAQAAGAVKDFGAKAAGYAGRQATGLNADTVSEFSKDTTLKPVSADELIAKREQLGGQISEALAGKKEGLGTSKEAVGQEIQSAIDKRTGDLTETGKGYQPIRESTTPVKVAPNYLAQTLKENTGLEIKDGQLTTSGKASIRDVKDVRALQSLYDTWQPEFAKGHLTPEEFLNFRSDLAKLSKFEREITKSAPLENLSGIMRGKFNETFRDKLPGLAELDTAYGSQISELKTLKKGLVDKNGELTDSGLQRAIKATQDKPQLLKQLEQVSPGITEKISAIQSLKELGKGLIDENGDITDTGMKKIVNAANESNPQMLAKLEEIKPGITKAIKQYKALQDVVNASEKFKVGTYGRNIGMAGVLGGIMTANPMLVASAVAEMVLTNPENAIKIIQTYVTTKPMLDNVITRVKTGAKATLKQINQLPEKQPALVGGTVFGSKPTQ